MAATKKTRKKKEVVAPIEVIPDVPPLDLPAIDPFDGPRLDEAGQTYLSKNDLLRYELQQHKLANSVQAIGLKNNEQQNINREYNQRIQQNLREIEQLRTVSKSIEDELRAMQQEILSKYGIDPRHLAYDDRTGLIHHVPDTSVKSG